MLAQVKRKKQTQINISVEEVLRKLGIRNRKNQYKTETIDEV